MRCFAERELKMRLMIFAIHDTKGEVFRSPFYQRTHGEAERSFKQLLDDPQSMVNKYPEDFDLYHLGEYDERTGKIFPLESPKHVLKASILKQNFTQ